MGLLGYLYIKKKIKDMIFTFRATSRSTKEKSCLTPNPCCRSVHIPLELMNKSWRCCSGLDLHIIINRCPACFFLHLSGNGRSQQSDCGGRSQGPVREEYGGGKEAPTQSLKCVSHEAVWQPHCSTLLLRRYYRCIFQRPQSTVPQATNAI